MRPRPLWQLSSSLCALLLACPAAPPKPPTAPQALTAEEERAALAPKVAALSAEAEGLLRDQDELVWRNWTAGQSVDIGKSYEGHGQLFTAESVKQIARLRELTADPLEQRALAHLHAHFVGEYLARELAEVTDAIANLEASLTFPFEGKDVPFRELDRTLAAEPSPERRRALYAAATPAVQRLGESVRRKDDRIDSLLSSVGYPSYAAFGAQLRELDLPSTVALANTVLQSTDGAWREVLGRLGPKEAGVPLEKLRRADFPRLFHSPSLDGPFPKQLALPRVRQTFSGLGLPLDAMSQLQIDDADRKGKNPRALTLPVVVPTDIRVSFRPAPGVRAQSFALHEVGHAVHYANTAAMRWELGKLGDSALAEGMGGLFEDLLQDPVWLEQFAQLSGDKAADYLGAASAFELFQLRRAAGHVLFEAAAHGADPIDPVSEYAKVMARAYGVPLDEADLPRAAYEREDFFASADKLRSAFLAAQLQGQLKARFGPSWWNTPQAASFLKPLWAKGNSATPEEVARSFGDPGVRADILLLRLASALKVPLTMQTRSPEAAADGGT